ncbi:MAG: translation initiation factor IF-2 [Candidatus Taylorbacteria bacterium]|nr:translation initiation factor IF-2 [Candidatus Taylorbacteria bacterium]
MPEERKKLIPRPPVVVVMGHIDHGKSSLLDYIRKTNLAASEAGGITQHIAAYEVIHSTAEGTKQITFVDTPGHEAFCGVRLRGAEVADIIILAVSAEDGVKEQTLDALRCIKESGKPYVVALTKIDKPTADIPFAKQSLAEHEVYIEGHGGTVPAVPISSKTGEGVDALLDIICLMSELENLTGEREADARGVCLEALLDPRRGIQATLIIKNGTLKVGQSVLCRGALAPVRFIESFDGRKIQSASFSSPVRITGWNKLPPAGYPFAGYKSKKEAERASAAAAEETPEPKTAAAADTEKILPLIIKADTLGSLEAVEYEIKKIKNDKIRPEAIVRGIGQITESDIKTALSAKGAPVLGFNVPVDETAKALSERSNVAVHLFEVIYKLIEWLEEYVRLKTPVTLVEELKGSAKILKTFSRSKDRQIVGGKVEEGVVLVGQEVRVLRRGSEIGRGKLRNLEHNGQKAEEIKKGMEFGALIESKTELAALDRLEAVEMVAKQ